MDSIKNRQMVYIGDDKDREANTVICPYCGRKIHFSRDNTGDPKPMGSCEHFTSIVMEAKYDSELTYEQYARFIEM
ncbi:MAG: hypothetical protein ACOC5L_03815 [Halobacteriota archaeon]